jgi:hypothetical protein
VGQHARTERRQTLGGTHEPGPYDPFRRGACRRGGAFGLEQEFGLKLYLAIPAAIAAYFATLIVLTLAFGSGSQTK